MVISQKDKEILRELAKKQWEYSQLPVMKERVKLWTDHNDLKGEKPPIHIELWTFEQDLLPPLRCEGAAARRMELEIYRNITNHERIDDDRVVYDYFPIQWNTWFRLFDLTVEVEHPEDGRRGASVHTPYKGFSRRLRKTGTFDMGCGP